MSVPQTLLLLLSKLHQIKGYSEGMQEGFQYGHLETLDAAILAEHMEKGMAHLCKLIDEACSIEQKLRENLRARGEEC
jgi:flagellar biosynthesis/type III secretory pathway protein FliH